MKYSLSSDTWDEKEIAAIEAVISSKQFTMGKYVKKFETKFSNYFGSKYAVMVNSGSSANLLMIASLFYTSEEKFRLNRGDEIIVPAVSWSTTYSPLYQYGLKIKFVDVDIATLNYDIDALRRSISPKTRAILTVNLLGNPNNFREINKIIKKKNIFLLEDNCESMGAKFEERYTGTYGIMGSFSSFYSHHISTMEGGIVVTDNEELYHILLCLRAHGWTRDLPKKNSISTKDNQNFFYESFRFVLPGYNLRPIEMSGAIGLEQLKKLEKFIKCRRENAKYFVEKFENHPYLSVQKEIGSSSWFGFALVVKENIDITRDSLIIKLSKNDIECRPIVSGNFAKNEVLRYFNFEISDDMKNAELIHERGFFVGNHQNNIKQKIELLSKVLS